MNDLHVVCPHCHSTNRLPAAKINDQPNCGKCGNSLFAGKPLQLTAATWEKHINRNDIPVVVDFWASWCGPCKMMTPVFAEAAGQLEPRVRLAKVNTEEERELAGRFGIRSIPTLVIFKNGREVIRQPGAMDLAALRKWVQSNI